jgi:hypothetical protein
MRETGELSRIGEVYSANAQFKQKKQGEKDKTRWEKKIISNV